MKSSSSERKISISRPRSSGMTRSGLTRTPWIMASNFLPGLSLGGSRLGEFVRSRVRHQVRRPAQRLERARIRPPAFQDAEGKRAFLQLHVVHVGNFELVAPARPQPANLLKHGAVIKIDSGHGIARLGLLRLLLDAQDAAVEDLRAAKAVGVW